MPIQVGKEMREYHKLFQGLGIQFDDSFCEMFYDHYSSEFDAPNGMSKEEFVSNVRTIRSSMEKFEKRKAI